MTGCGRSEGHSTPRRTVERSNVRTVERSNVRTFKRSNVRMFRLKHSPWLAPGLSERALEMCEELTGGFLGVTLPDHRSSAFSESQVRRALLSFPSNCDSLIHTVPTHSANHRPRRHIESAVFHLREAL